MIIDLHCDLLSHPTFSYEDPSVRCSPDQLILGGVSVQVCAMFTDFFQQCEEQTYAYQNHLFLSLSQQDPRIANSSFEFLQTDRPLSLIRSIENASLLGGDSEDLKLLFHRLALAISEGPLAYIGIVWNHRNRFGGGCLEPYGLSQDGRDLLEVMALLGIPLDLSHCCDRLTEDILDYKINKLPNLRVLASHSNFRSIQDHCRNLLDEHAKELVKQGGIIGLNMLQAFLGNSLHDIQHHIQYARYLDCLHHMALGTDFFYSHEQDKFFTNCSTAKDHPRVHHIIREYTSESESQDILYRTANNFLYKTIQQQKENAHHIQHFLHKGYPKQTPARF